MNILMEVELRVKKTTEILSTVCTQSTSVVKDIVTSFKD
jgi:hypothetical protein